MGSSLHQNATYACTAVVQKPTKLCQTGSNGGFPLISLRNPSHLLAWPCTHPGDPALSGGGPAILDSGAYIYIYGSASRAPPSPPDIPPAPPVGVGCGVGKPCPSANLMHALHHMDPALPLECYICLHRGGTETYQTVSDRPQC